MGEVKTRRRKSAPLAPAAPLSTPDSLTVNLERTKDGAGRFAEGAGPLFLILDQGGHAGRAAVVDTRGDVLVLYTLPIRTLHNGDRVEHEPEEVVASLRDAACRAVSELGSDAVRLAAAGLATQRSNVVCWNKVTGEALSPIISWQDRRGRHWLDTFARHGPAIRERTGLLLSPHYGASKLRWCLDHVEAVQAALHDGQLAWGPMSAYLIFRLLEERPLAVDPVTASRTLLWNLGTRTWDPELLDLFGLPQWPLPACTANRGLFGHLNAAGHRIPLTVLTGDQAAVLFAFGPPQSDSVQINAGTGVFLQQCGVRPEGDTPLLRSIAWIDDGEATEVLEGTVNGGASALHLEAARLGVEDIEQKLPLWIGRYPDPPLFLNGVGGLGSPYWISDFPSRYIGAGDEGARLVGVLESIVFLIQRNLEVFARGPQAPRRLIVSGGLAVMDGLCQKLADLSRVPVLRAPEMEATVRGLGFLVAGRSGAYTAPEWERIFSPRAAAGLQERYERWCAAMVY